MVPEIETTVPDSTSVATESEHHAVVSNDLELKAEELENENEEHTAFINASWSESDSSGGENSKSIAFLLPYLMVALVFFASGLIVSNFTKSSFVQPMDYMGLFDDSNSSTSMDVSYSYVNSQEGINVLSDLYAICTSKGIRAGLEETVSRMASSSTFLGSCHPLMHKLGRKLYVEGGIIKTLAPLVATVGTGQSTSLPERHDVDLLLSCNAAYMHGIIEQYLDEFGNDKLDFLEKQLCTPLGTVGGWLAKWECYHGLGHGILQNERKAANIASLKSSIDTCRSSSDQRTCINGLWMDYFAFTAVANDDADPTSNPLAVCIIVDPGTCYMYAPTAFLLHRPRAYTQALDWCVDSCKNLPAYRTGGCTLGCIGGVGMQTFKENLDDLRIVEAVCLVLKGASQRSKCFNGALGYYSFAMRTAVPASLCNQLKVPEFKSLCSHE